MPKIEIEIRKDIWDQLKNVVPEDAIPKLAAAALQEWAGWLGGTSRPTTITELEIARIFEIYDTALQDEFPSVDHLGQQFSMPMGRARYIVQSLEYRRGRFMQQRQIRAISHALEDGQWSQDRKNCVITIDRSSQTFIDRIIGDLHANSKIGSIVKGTATLDGVRYELGDGHHKQLTAKFKELLAGFTA
jgi:hypothetical protein